MVTNIFNGLHLVKKTLDVACCKAKGVPKSCLGLCQPSDSSSAFRSSPAFLPNTCDAYRELVNDQCVVAFSRPGNFKLNYSSLNLL